MGKTDEEAVAELLEDIKEPTEDLRALLERGNVGRSLELTLDDAGISHPQTLLNLAGPSKDATVLTITLFTELPGARFPGPPAIATLKWGVGGVQSVAEVDFLHGVSLSLPASFVRVDARREPLSVPVARARVGAFASYLPKTVNIIPQRTLQVPSSGSFPLAVASTVVFNVPFYAGNLRVFREPRARIFIEFLNALTVVEYMIDVPRDVDLLEMMPMANNIRQIRIRNIGTPVIDRMSLIFGLAL